MNGNNFGEIQWKCIDSEELISNRWIGVSKDVVVLPNGEIIYDFFRIRVSDASAVVALTSDGHIVLKKEYRYCYNKVFIELPSGVFEPNEKDPLSVAKRELYEETGYVSENWEYLGDTIENAAKLTNHIHLFVAKDCKRIANQKLDKTEAIEVMVVPVDKAVKMVMSNDINCNCTAHAIMRVARLLGI